MEFPNLGEQCSVPSCRRLDYLPLRCDACRNLFCQEHINYNNHECPSSYKKDNRVPVCPLCNQPVPGKRGESPDEVVEAHIKRECESDTAKKSRKIFTNKCSVKNCRAKEVVPFTCNDCRMNYCLKHRHPADHQCEGQAASSRRRAAEAAMARHAKAMGSGAPSTTNHASQSPGAKSRGRVRDTVTVIQGSLSEDEALARALALSMQDTAQQNGHMTTEEQVQSDHVLAQQIAASERHRRTRGASPSRKCIVS